jgi:nucleoside-diphosphate-sugar epimerase
VILGPREYVGRLPWWLRRIAAGGQVLAPGDPGRTIQPVDVRDIARLAVQMISDGKPGTVNVTAPPGRETFGGLLAACAAVTGTAAELRWVPDAQLVAAGVRQWSEMPLWRTAPGVWQVGSKQAEAAGLTCRPVAETAADTWSWIQSGDAGAADIRAVEIGLSRERETQVLTALACQR